MSSLRADHAVGTLLRLLYRERAALTHDAAHLVGILAGLLRKKADTVGLISSVEAGDGHGPSVLCEAGCKINVNLRSLRRGRVPGELRHFVLHCCISHGLFPSTFTFYVFSCCVHYSPIRIILRLSAVTHVPIFAFCNNSAPIRKLLKSGRRARSPDGFRSFLMGGQAVKPLCPPTTRNAKRSESGVLNTYKRRAPRHAAGLVSKASCLDISLSPSSI